MMLSVSVVIVISRISCFVCYARFLSSQIQEGQFHPFIVVQKAGSINLG